MKSRVRGVKIKAICAGVPAYIQKNEILDFDAKLKKKVITMTGVQQKHVLKNEESLLNIYCSVVRAAFKFIEPHEVDAIVVVTQTPEHRIPTNANLLHGLLGLKKDALAFDINQGCSGYVYGLYIAMSLFSNDSDIKKMILCTGDAISKVVNPKNKSTAFLFGDAATVTVLEKDENASDSYFLLRSDGSGAENLIIPDGGIAHPFSQSSYIDKIDVDGSVNNDASLYMNGSEVFNFTNVEVPVIIDDILSYTGKKKEDIDAYCFHQANKFMLSHLADKIGVADKTPINIESFGNTSSASIPLLITTHPDSCLKKKVLLTGFGVGYSMASALVDLSETSVEFMEV